MNGLFRHLRFSLFAVGFPQCLFFGLNLLGDSPVLTARPYYWRRLSTLLSPDTELCEFHCMLVRTDVFDQLGSFDESILNTKEHLDFCMNVMALGQTVYFEPDSLITYVPGPPLAWRDLPFYMLRWSNDWELISLDRLKEKWDLCEDGYFKHKYKALGWRRRDAIVQPLLDKIGLTDRRSLPNKLLMFGLLAPIEKSLRIED